MYFPACCHADRRPVHEEVVDGRDPAHRVEGVWSNKKFTAYSAAPTGSLVSIPDEDGSELRFRNVASISKHRDHGNSDSAMHALIGGEKAEDLLPGEMFAIIHDGKWVVARNEIEGQVADRIRLSHVPHAFTRPDWETDPFSCTIRVKVDRSAGGELDVTKVERHGIWPVCTTIHCQSSA